MSDDNIFGETDWIDDQYTQQLLPPTLQWRRGDLTSKEKALKLGCWELPADQFEAILGGSQEPVDVLHAGGVVVSAYIFETLHLLVLAWKKRWYVLEDEKIRYLTGYEEGAKSKLQYWALVKELGNQPAMVSVSGMSAKYLSEASFSFQQKVLRPAGQMAKRAFGQHHFWMPLASQGKKDTKQGQYITPPGLALKEVNQEIIKSLFVGREVGELAESMIGEARRWAKETFQQTQGQQVGNGRPVPEQPPVWHGDEEFEEQPVDIANEIPF